jgi:hypothetical protein
MICWHNAAGETTIWSSMILGVAQFINYLFGLLNET